jgi:immune inhibitor A
VKKLVALLSLLLFVGCSDDDTYITAPTKKPHPKHPRHALSTTEFDLRVMPPHESNIRGKLIYPDLLAKRVNQPSESFLQSVPTGQVRILALLVDFSDKIHSVQASYFDSLMFDIDGNSVRNYWSEVSYAQMDLISVNLPSAAGWATAPQTYAYYVNGQFGFGTYPNNTQKLTEDLVDAVDGVVDFSQYDNDANGTVDIVMVIHAGRGAELTGNATDIWSHKWNISPRLKDGVTISAFTMTPEYWYSQNDMTIGVYAHELGHGFGLPDLYDTDQSSNGIGRWCLMSYGSWNGNLGSHPSYPDAWAKHLLRFTIPTVLTTTTYGLTIPPINFSSVSYKIVNPLNTREYFIFENRLKTGYERYALNDGLLVWHIDDGVFYNNWEWYPGLDSTYHMHVAMEQADGFYELEKGVNRGSSGDTWPGIYNKTLFSPTTLPSSNWYKSKGIFSLQNIRKVGTDIVLDVVFGDSIIEPPDTVVVDKLFAPYALTAYFNSLDRSVQLNWQDSSTKVDKVYIERQDKKQKGGWASYRVIDSTTGTSYTDVTMPIIQQAKYRVRQRSGIVVSGFSNEAKVFLK